MKNRLLFLLGLFVALTVSFGGIVLGSHAQLGKLAPYFDDAESQTFPLRSSGIAARGQLVYADLGCAACHTQQVRRPDFGSDHARGWGERQSVARDYIFQIRPQLGASRLGPDLTNYGARAKKAEGDPTPALYAFLYHGTPAHPGFKFLFNERAIVGEASTRAVTIPGAAPTPGREIVPTERAQSLAAYLLSLSTGYDYPEARPVAPAAAHGAHAEAAAPDEKKNAGEPKK